MQTMKLNIKIMVFYIDSINNSNKPILFGFHFQNSHHFLFAFDKAFLASIYVFLIA